MNKSETITKLADALCKAQAKFEGASKDKVNPHFRSKYADLGNVVDAIKEPLAAHGLSFVQVVHDAEAAAKIETIILHSSGEWLSCGVTSVPVTKNDAQGYGSAMTYCRRYSLSAAFGIAPEDDDGNAAAKAAPDEPTPEERKAAHDDAAEKYADAIVCIKDGCASGDYSQAAEVWFTLPDEVKQALWIAPKSGGIFTTRERDIMKSKPFREAHFGVAA